MSKPWVYIASPYSNGDVGANVHSHMQTFNRLLSEVYCTPIAPLLTHFVHVLHPRPYDRWMEYDREIMERCDACFRVRATAMGNTYMQQESSGADTEVAFFRSRRRPVFHALRDLETWCEQFKR